MHVWPNVPRFPDSSRSHCDGSRAGAQAALPPGDDAVEAGGLGLGLGAIGCSVHLQRCDHLLAVIHVDTLARDKSVWWYQGRGKS